MKMKDFINQRFGSINFVIKPMSMENKRATFLVNLYNTKNFFSFTYSSYYQDKPRVSDIVLCLQSDCHSYLNTPKKFDFLEEFGYTEQDVKMVKQGIKTWKGCRRTVKKMKKLLGSETFETFLECEE